MADRLGPGFPAWLQTNDDVFAWMRTRGVRPGWGDRAVLPAGSEVYYEDRDGNRLYCRVQESSFVAVLRTDHGVAGRTTTVLVPVRWAEAQERRP